MDNTIKQQIEFWKLARRVFAIPRSSRWRKLRDIDGHLAGLCFLAKCNAFDICFEIQEDIREHLKATASERYKFTDKPLIYLADYNDKGDKLRVKLANKMIRNLTKKLKEQEAKEITSGTLDAKPLRS